MVGTWMQQVAMSWLVYRLTGSAAMLGTIGFLSQLPVFLLSTVGGVLADRYDRRKILFATQGFAMLLAACLAVLTLTGHAQVWSLILLSICSGIFNALDMPARQSFIADMVPAEDMSNAIALNASIFHGSRVVGPALAGLLVSVVGEGWCFSINAASFVAVLVGLAMMQTQFHAKPKKMSALQSTLEGFRFVWGHARIRRLLTLVASISIFGMSYMVLMPIIADKVLHGGVRGMGILMGMSGVGALVGALKLARRGHVEGLERRIALSIMGFSSLLILFALCHHFWIAALLMLPIGFCQVSQMASSNTLLQSMINNEYRGRVMAVYGVMFMGMMPFGALLSGHVAHLIGTVATIVLGSSLTFCAGLVFLLKTRA